ncbi:MAG: glycosyltransferase [Clostridiales bacterium]|nr:glycosyltransferase [Clostridiales bacterium]
MSYNIYIYGAGKLGRRCYDFLKNSGMQVAGFLVSDATGNPGCIGECPVLEYKNANVDKSKDLIVVALNQRFRDEVCPKLKADGVKRMQFFPYLRTAEKPKKQNRVLIFGTGKYALENRQYFYEEEVVGYLDNNKSVQKTRIDEKLVYAPSVVKKLDFDYVCVMSPRNAVEMTLQLLKLGVEKEKIISLLGYRSKFYRAVNVRLVLDCPRPKLFPTPEIYKDVKKCEKVVFQVSKTPVVSIIIPVYNQFAYTYNCLKAIKDHSGAEIPYEVIVADDKSSDQTKNLETVAPGLTVIHNKSNLRFLKNCNNAAKHAKGKYILFLNNDTQVQDNWLKPLVDLIESDKKIGMVGSKLIYPDGVLQEAGGILWKDGSAWNYGNKQNPTLPEFNYVKEADYISGASIMIRSDLWNEIGGFDERFCPAYCEDSDLAFEVRKHGYRVMYQPASVVVHFEGASNGTDTTTGQKKYQVVNMEKFYNKWKDVLDSEHFENGQNVFLARDRSCAKKHILVVNDIVPTFDKDAGSKTVYQYLKMFVAKGYSVKYVADNFFLAEPYTTCLQQMGVEVLGGAWYAQNFWNWFDKIGDCIDVVYLNRPHISVKYIDKIAERKGPKVVYYGHDLHYLRLLREYELTGDKKYLSESDYYKKIEFSVMRKADVCHYPSQVEIDAIHNEDSSINAKAINAYVYDRFLNDLDFDCAKRKGILFVGGFGHRPNVDAVLWFASEVYPVIRKKAKIPFYIVGSKPTQEILNLDGNGIIVKGFVSDEELANLYRSCKLVVVPLRYGAGVKGKVVEALYNGMPIVTTSVGAEGIPGISNVVEIKDSVQAFASSVIKLYENDKKLVEMSRAAQALIKKHFSAAAAWKLIKDDF